MKEGEMGTRRSLGQAALIVVFGLGMMGVLSALAFSWFGPKTVIRQKALVDSSKAYYAAQSGIDELMIRLRSHHNFGNVWDMVHELDNGSVFYATISGDLETKIATATGKFGAFTRRLEVRVASSSAKTSFLFAVQSGNGGFELERGTRIEGVGGKPGNVYSNADILGERMTSGTSGSKILGNAWAVGKISGLNGDTTGGVYITGDAAANELIRCEVLGDVQAPAAPMSGCSYGGGFTVAEAPEVRPMETVDIVFWKQQAESSLWPGDCMISGKAGPSDCSGVEKQLGSVKIEGNLVVDSNTDFTLTGPVWVEGDLTINSNVDIYVDESLGIEGVVVVVDYPADQFARGKIETASNVDFFETPQGGPAVFVSTNTEDDCSAVPAIRVASNTATVVFTAPNGCVFFQSNSFVRGVLAKKIHLSNNSVIEYDPRLATVILRTGLGGWAVTSFRETGN
jgi:hypothetical protein